MPLWWTQIRSERCQQICTRDDTGKRLPKSRATCTAKCTNHQLPTPLGSWNEHFLKVADLVCVRYNAGRGTQCVIIGWCRPWVQRLAQVLLPPYTEHGGQVLTGTGTAVSAPGKSPARWLPVTTQRATGCWATGRLWRAHGLVSQPAVSWAYSSRV